MPMCYLLNDEVIELALYQTLGLSKFNIIYILMLEQLLIFIITAILGIIIGILVRNCY